MLKNKVSVLLLTLCLGTGALLSPTANAATTDDNGSAASALVQKPGQFFEKTRKNIYDLGRTNSGLRLQNDTTKQSNITRQASAASVSASSGEVVKLKDPQLEKAIKTELGISRDLVESDFAGLRSLDAIDWGITSIEGLERAVNLEELLLGANGIKDFTPLAKLDKLTTLNLVGNPAANINFLTSLPNLEMVSIAAMPLNMAKGADARNVVEKLEANGVEVTYNLISVHHQAIGDKAFGFKWTDYNDFKADSYKIMYGKFSSGTEPTIVDTTSDELFLTGLEPNQMYAVNIIPIINGDVPKDFDFWNMGTWVFTTASTPLLQNWVDLGGSWYYYDNSTGQLKKDWLLDGQTWYYLNQDGKMQTGWINWKDNWYYLDLNSGAMKTGWSYDGWDWYYLTGSGTMATGWYHDGWNWYYLKSSGAMATGWYHDGWNWYYLKSSGAMATGWYYDGWNWYYLKNSGAMATGWVTTGGKWYYLYNNGSMAVNTTIGKYKVGGDGAWIR